MLILLIFHFSIQQFSWPTDTEVEYKTKISFSFKNIPKRKTIFSIQCLTCLISSPPKITDTISFLEPTDIPTIPTIPTLLISPILIFIPFLNIIQQPYNTFLIQYSFLILRIFDIFQKKIKFFIRFNNIRLKS